MSPGCKREDEAPTEPLSNHYQSGNILRFYLTFCCGCFNIRYGVSKSLEGWNSFDVRC